MSDPFVATALSPMRKVIASRMTEAMRTIPHFRLVAAVEVDRLMDLHREVRDQDAQVKVSVNDLIIKACALALMDSPAMNIQWAENEVRQFRSADVSAVMAINEGLYTPIIRNADSKSIWEIARETKDLTTRAAGNALRMDEIYGGTFSVSNLGMYGVDQFDAIINPPQCAILAVGSIKPRCVVSEAGELRVARVLRATLSIDHRALDGVTAARFLGALRNRLMEPEDLASRQ